ncbi:hypothetical protein ACIA5G_38395 [Amycolatopsis sp. NPDC051758]|uniref:hypothetical protein n=1 Tax=Amycolatopsis sp. NPDC051758 TaxID=3363935 RepID=UPI003792514E
MRFVSVFRTAAVIAAAVLLSPLLSAPAAQGATTTACSSGYSYGMLTLSYPSSTVNLGTNCSNFADAGSPYTFTIDLLDVVTHQLPFDNYYAHVTATCKAYSYPDGSLVATGCSYVIPR